jgi:3-phosphoshikimate 1-carboxyvinyltransferase
MGKGEPMGDVVVKSSKLKAVKVRKEEIPSLIDELPVLMVAASLAQGTSVFENIGELRVKETDRISSMTENLRSMGACIEVKRGAGQEDMIITGVKAFQAAKVKSFSDHRTAMSVIIAGLVATGQTRVDDISCINKSFPGFLRALKSLIR